VDNLLSNIEWGRLTVYELDELLVEEYGQGFLGAQVVDQEHVQRGQQQEEEEGQQQREEKQQEKEQQLKQQRPHLAPLPAFPPAPHSPMPPLPSPMQSPPAPAPQEQQQQREQRKEEKEEQLQKQQLQEEQLQEQQQEQREKDPTTQIEPELELPAGWKEFIDDATGDPYFYNDETGETVWEPPGEVHVTTGTGTGTDLEFDVDVDTVAATVVGAGQGQHQARALPSDWAEYVDDESGDLYYVNSISGEAAWDRPVD
jgi:glucan-binding YG repeat protein